MEQNYSNWMHMISTQVGDCKLAFFRTKCASGADSKHPGHGYFVLLFFTVFSNSQKQDRKIPLKLLPFLRKKHNEFGAGNKASEGIEIDGIKYSLVAWPDSDSIQMNCYDIANDSNHLANLKMGSLKKLITCLEVLGLLLKNQPSRKVADFEYKRYANDLMCWAAAKCAYTEVRKLLPPGKKIETVEEYMKLWSQVEETQYEAFQACVAKHQQLVKNWVPVPIPTDSLSAIRLREEFAAFGYMFTRPDDEWQPMQLLIELLPAAEC